MEASDTSQSGRKQEERGQSVASFFSNFPTQTRRPDYKGGANRNPARRSHERARPLHRLFGLSWIDFFQNTTISVETEIDLSLKQQFLDLVLIRLGGGPIPRPLPDGFEDLAGHNLVTFKSSPGGPRTVGRCGS